MHPMHLPMKVLIACEFSGVVRRAFDRLGHDVWSCDLRRSDDNSNRHIVGNVLDILDWGWDLLIVAHPPCTCLWLRGIDPLVPTFTTVSDAALAAGLPADAKPVDRVHMTPGGLNQAKERARFYDGIANAMALQWGGQALVAYGEAA